MKSGRRWKSTQKGGGQQVRLGSDAVGSPEPEPALAVADEVGDDARTGQANQADTIKAVNLAGLDYYIAKPWSVAEMDAVVRKLLTDVVEATGLDPMPHLAALDPVRAMDLVRRRLGDR